MTLRLGLMTLLPVLLLPACADTLKATPVSYARPKVTAETATVVFVQQGAFMRWRILDSKTFLGKTERDSYFEAQVAPGRHRFYAYHPEGSAWSKDGFCHGVDADLEAGKLYVVVVRFISPLTGKLETSGASAAIVNGLVEMGNDAPDTGQKIGQNDLNITLRFLSSRAQVGMDAAGFFQKKQRLAMDRAAGQQEFDEWFPKSQALQRLNLNFKYEVNESKIHTWADYPPPCTTANNDQSLAANQNFPLEGFDRKPGKRARLSDAMLADIPAVAERECGKGVAYALETRRKKTTQTTRDTKREGNYDVTYEIQHNTWITDGDIICDSVP